MGVSGAGRDRAARALRLLLLVVMALGAVEYLCGSIFEASPLRTYIYTPFYNATQPTLKSREKPTQVWPKIMNELNTNPEVLKTAVATSISTAKIIPKAPLNVDVNVKAEGPVNADINVPVNLELNVPAKAEVKLPVNKVVNTTAIAHVNVPTVTLAPSESSIIVTKITESIKNKDAAIETESTEEPSNNTSKYCELPSDLGPIQVNKTEINLKSIENLYPEVGPGGWHKPPNCTAKHKVAIIIPYRDREAHLALFLRHMHPFLMRQQLDYGIFVIEQQDSGATPKKFNRAKLFNVGFVEANKARHGGWQCFIFHDVDLLPLDERNLYSCPRQPRHMSASLDKHHYKEIVRPEDQLSLLYPELFGGVSALTYEQMMKVNGFSNKYWGWGGEDDDMSYRLRKMHYYIARYKMSIARYTMLSHSPQSANPKRYKLLSQTDKNFKKDGLSSLHYEVISIVKHRLFTLVSVNIDENS